MCPFYTERPSSCFAVKFFPLRRRWPLSPVKAAPADADSGGVLVTNHVLAGAAIGALVKRPLPALAVGVVSHLAMDRIPHWGLSHEDRQGDPMKNPTFLRVAYRDGFAGLAAMGAAFGLARGRRVPVLAGMVGAALLDLDKPSRHFFGMSPFPRSVDQFHCDIQQGREHAHKMRQELAVAAGLIGLVAGLCWSPK